jgi:hypothetical protein
MTELVPSLTVPTLCTTNLARLLAHYRDELGFDVVQQIPGVVAFIRNGPASLQLWQRASGIARDCRIRLDGQDANVFRLHARLAQHARRALGEDAPMLRPWGAWEFSLIDIEGNRLTFVQWVVNSVFQSH